MRNARFHAQLRVEIPITGVKKTRRVLLVDKEGKPVGTVAQAAAELKRLHTQRADKVLPVLERTPKFQDYAKRYLEFIGSGQGAKKPGTVEKETAILGRWVEVLGELRLDQVKRVHVNRFIEARLKQNVSARTINLDVIALRVVLKRALSDGLIQRLLTEGLRPLKTTARERPLFTTADLDALCAAAFAIDTSGKLVCVRHELALQPGLAIYEQYPELNGGKVKLEGDTVVEFPRLPEFQPITLRVLRREERDKRLVIKEAEVVG